MAQTHKRFPRIKKWFPDGDSLAKLIARLVIIREDLMLESWGIAEDGLGVLDSNGHIWRRLYFFRRNLLTLIEFRSVLTKLETDRKPGRDFHRLYSCLDEKGVAAVEEARSHLERFQSELKETRNRVGGHVKADAVGMGLEGIPDDETGIIEYSREHGLRCRLATDLLLSAIYPDECHSEKLRLTEELIVKAGTATGKALVASISILQGYMKLKGLV